MLTRFNSLLLKAASIIALSAFVALPASAVVITFDSLTGNNGDEFTSTTESGFTVADVTGGWVEAHNFGNGTPSIFSAEDLGTVRVTSGSLFNFLSVDLGNANQGATTSIGFTITGLLSGTARFSISNPDIGSQGVFTTITAIPVVSGIAIDELLISINGTNTSSYNIDNINVAAVAEPSTLMLLGAGLLGFVARRRKLAA